MLQFVKYEAECETNGFSASETFKLLIVKHEEYLALNSKVSDIGIAVANLKLSKVFSNRPDLKCFGILSQS